jgi:hypothetical protein
MARGRNHPPLRIDACIRHPSAVGSTCSRGLPGNIWHGSGNKRTILFGRGLRIYPVDRDCLNARGADHQIDLGQAGAPFAPGLYPAGMTCRGGPPEPVRHTSAEVTRVQGLLQNGLRSRGRFGPGRLSPCRRATAYQAPQQREIRLRPTRLPGCRSRRMPPGASCEVEAAGRPAPARRAAHPLRRKPLHPALCFSAAAAEIRGVPRLSGSRAWWDRPVRGHLRESDQDQGFAQSLTDQADVPSESGPQDPRRPRRRLAEANCTVAAAAAAAAYTEQVITRRLACRLSSPPLDERRSSRARYVDGIKALWGELAGAPEPGKIDRLGASGWWPHIRPSGFPHQPIPTPRSLLRSISGTDFGANCNSPIFAAWRNCDLRRSERRLRQLRVDRQRQRNQLDGHIVNGSIPRGEASASRWAPDVIAAVGSTGAPRDATCARVRRDA